MTILAVMQPTYMPWMGYFDLIDCVDEFVFLDDVQLARQSWQTRNRIRGPGGDALILSVPIQHSGSIDTSIANTKIADGKPWRRKHIRTIEQTYARTGYGKWAAGVWARALGDAGRTLADLTINAIATVCREIGIQTPLHRASALSVGGDRVLRLAKFCEHFGASTYLSPPGAADYLEDDGAQAQFLARGIDLRFQHYVHPEYDQGGSDFLSHLGIVDLLAHAGADRTLEIIRSGHRPHATTDTLARA